MHYVFGGFSLDTASRELSADDRPLAVEPQVFDLLVMLVEERHRVVTKDEIVERIWAGRAISDWALLSRIKSLRRVLGDDGASQRMVRTLRGRGFRFVGDVRLRAAPADVAGPVEARAEAPGSTRPCIAVLPFALVGDVGLSATIADAVPRELIRSLSSLHWLKVIAHGSSFRFRGEGVELDQVRAVLGADYCLSGHVEQVGDRIFVDVELADTRSGHVVWADRKDGPLDEIQSLRARIAATVINVSEFEITRHEASLLDIDVAESLDAWALLHCGIQQVYRLNRPGTEAARMMFERATVLEPTLARAHAALSFTAFQRIFRGYSTDASEDMRRARASAEASVALEPRDPFANVVMGRSFWLEGNPEASKPWFERAIAECPNYAFAHYAASWANVFTGDYAAGARTTDQALALSPLDPMRAGMLCNKMWIALAAEDYEAAAEWAEVAAYAPGSHAGHAMFAAMAHLMKGDLAAVERWVREMRRRNPDFSRDRAVALVPASHQAFSQLVLTAATNFGL